MENSYSYLVGDIIYTSAGYYRVTSAGLKSTKPTGTNPTGFTGPLTSVPLFAINSSTGAVSGSAVNFTRSKGSIYYNPCGIYNSATGGMHSDGRFSAVDISMAFTETRALHKEDVEKGGY